MKYISLLILMLSLGCASTKKNADTVVTAKPVEKSNSTPSIDKPANKDEPKFFCTKEKEQRILEINKKENGCFLKYTKSGKVNVAASSSHGFKHCHNSMEKIRFKLEKAGFHCS